MKKEKSELLSDELYSTQFIYGHDVNIYQKRDGRYKIMVDDSLIDIQIQSFNIVNFNFSKSFNDAIEAKVTAEQNALAEKNKLEQVKYEAEQKVVAAEAQAKAIEIQAKAIQNQGGKEYVNLKWIEKWNGKLPVTVAGGDSSFIMMMDK